MSNTFQLSNATALINHFKGFFFLYIDVLTCGCIFTCLENLLQITLPWEKLSPIKRQGGPTCDLGKPCSLHGTPFAQIYFCAPFTLNVRKEKLTCQLGGPVCLVISPTLIFYISPGSLGSSAHPRGPKNHRLETEWKVVRSNKQLYFYTQPHPAAEDRIITAVQNSVDHLKCGRGVRCS